MGEWKAQGRHGGAKKDPKTKTLRKFDDARSSIDDWRWTIGDCGERRQPGRLIWRSQERKVLTKARVLTAISGGKQPN